jgi:S-adenosylmethionine synthetase
VLKAFQAKEGVDVVGLANSRAGEGLQKLDLTNEEDVEAFFEKFKPNCNPL